jgi:hypothetical protein
LAVPQPATTLAEPVIITGTFVELKGTEEGGLLSAKVREAEGLALSTTSARFQGVVEVIQRSWLLKE